MYVSKIPRQTSSYMTDLDKTEAIDETLRMLGEWQRC